MWCCWSIFYKEEPSALPFLFLEGEKISVKKIRKNNMTAGKVRHIDNVKRK